MKLNKETLKQIIKEELDQVLSEQNQERPKLPNLTPDEQKIVDKIQQLIDSGDASDAVQAIVLAESFKETMPNIKQHIMDNNKDKFRKYAVDEVERGNSFRNLRKFYEPDDRGGSPFSRAVTLVPELREEPRIKRALDQVGGNASRVTAKIGGRKSWLKVNQHFGLR